MYADQSDPAERKKSNVRSRLGVVTGGVQKSAPAPRALETGGLFKSAVSRLTSTISVSKPRNESEGKWSHDLFDDEEQSDDLRRKLASRDSSRSRGSALTRISIAHREAASAALSGARGQGRATDLRQKLAGPVGPPVGSMNGPSTAPKRAPRHHTTDRRLTVTIDNEKANSVATSGRTSRGRRDEGEGERWEEEEEEAQRAGGRGSEAAAMSVDGGESKLASFLGSLGLDKYTAIFQQEEIDMAALRHMKEDDLRELGIPMGPRKKILLAVMTKP